MKNSKQNNKVIQPAQRVSSVKEYYFSKKLREIAGMNASGADIISLGVGGPDLPPSEEVIDTLTEEAHKSNTHGYQPYVGIPELRRAFSEWYRRVYGVELDPQSEIQPLIGSKEGILHITLAFVNPGDSVLVPNPGYPTYTSVSSLAGANILTYDLDEQNHWQPDFDQLEALAEANDNIKLMWVNYPNMPTGAASTLELLKKLVEFGKKHGIVIVNDNPYSFILHREQLSILSVEGAKDVAIEMNSLSKSHNMAGWRIGMVAAKPEFIQWILRVKSNIDSGQFRPMMMAAVKALSLPKEWYDYVNSNYRGRRKIAEQIMNVLGCKFDPEQGGLFLWGKIPEEAESAEKFADNILYNASVFITPGFIFGSRGERYIRISLCANEQRMQEALERITKLVSDK